jgi:hypothetical protein
MGAQRIRKSFSAVLSGLCCASILERRAFKSRRAKGRTSADENLQRYSEREDKKGQLKREENVHEYGGISHAHRQYAIECHGGVGVYYDVLGIKTTQEQWQHGNQLFFCELSRTQ